MASAPAWVDWRIFISSNCNVLSCGLLLLYRYVSNHEFHCPTAMNRATVASTGAHSGSTIRKKITRSLAPSMRALSCSSMGSSSMYERIMEMLKALTSMGRMYTQNVPIRCRSRMSRKPGIRPPLTYSVIARKRDSRPRPRKSRRLRTYATMAHAPRLSTVPTTVRATEMKKACGMLPYAKIALKLSSVGWRG